MASIELKTAVPGPASLALWERRKAAVARGLTTLHPPLEALGEQAVRMLLSRLNGDDLQMQMRLRSHLVPRSTTLFSPTS